MAEMVETAWHPEAEARAKAPLPVNLATALVSFTLAVAVVRPPKAKIPQAEPVAVELVIRMDLTAAVEQTA